MMTEEFLNSETREMKLKQAKDFTIALKKFNRMFERLSNVKTVSKPFLEECKIVRNYGQNMLKIFKDINNTVNLEEVRNKQATLNTIIFYNKGEC